MGVGDEKEWVELGVSIVPAEEKGKGYKKEVVVVVLVLGWWLW